MLMNFWSYFDIQQHVNAWVPWIFFILSTIILIITPTLSGIAAKFERHSQLTSRWIHWLIAALVVYHIMSEAMSSSGMYIMIFAASGFMVTTMMRLMSQAMEIKTLPIIPTLIAFTMAMHGLFDGYAFRTAAAHPLWWHSLADADTVTISTSGISIASYSLALSCLLHRIPESLYLWRMISTNISRSVALLCLFILGASTLVSLVMSEELIRSSRPIYLNLSYLQVFIAGVILSSATAEHLFNFKSTAHPDPATSP